MSKYYLTVVRNEVDLVRRMEFRDFADAMAHTAQYYRVRVDGSRATLEFTTEVLNGRFARAYAQLTPPEKVDPREEQWQHQKAAKQSCAFVYDGTILFLIESDLGVEECDAFNPEED